MSDVFCIGLNQELQRGDRTPRNRAVVTMPGFRRRLARYAKQF